MKPTVLVVDDDPDIVSLIRDFLESNGYDVIGASDASTALDELGRTSIDCVLLDVMMPGISGFEVMRSIREQGDVPVIYLTARDSDADKIRGFGLGADDYIVKSVSPVEIVARVNAVLRRANRGGSPPRERLLDFGGLVIDLDAREVHVNGSLVDLTAREFDLLHHLARHPRRVFPRDVLFECLWGEFGDRRTVTVHISRLREKIERDSAHPEYIATVRGIGYRFEGVPQ